MTVLAAEVEGRDLRIIESQRRLYGRRDRHAANAVDVNERCRSHVSNWALTRRGAPSYTHGMNPSSCSGNRGLVVLA